MLVVLPGGAVAVGVIAVIFGDRGFIVAVAPAASRGRGGLVPAMLLWSTAVAATNVRVGVLHRGSAHSIISVVVLTVVKVVARAVAALVGALVSADSSFSFVGAAPLSCRGDVAVVASAVVVVGSICGGGAAPMGSADGVGIFGIQVTTAGLAFSRDAIVGEILLFADSTGVIGAERTAIYALGPMSIVVGVVIVAIIVIVVARVREVPRQPHRRVAPQVAEEHLLYVTAAMVLLWGVVCVAGVEVAWAALGEVGVVGPISRASGEAPVGIGGGGGRVLGEAAGGVEGGVGGVCTMRSGRSRLLLLVGVALCLGSAPLLLCRKRLGSFSFSNRVLEGPQARLRSANTAPRGRQRCRCLGRLRLPRCSLKSILCLCAIVTSIAVISSATAPGTARWPGGLISAIVGGAEELVVGTTVFASGGDLSCVGRLP